MKGDEIELENDTFHHDLSKEKKIRMVFNERSKKNKRIRQWGDMHETQK